MIQDSAYPKVKIRLVDQSLPLPEYKTQGAAAFDLVSREDILIPSGEVGYAPLNVVIEAPAGHMLMLAARSSLHKRGLKLANGTGIVDQDFSGNGDECRAALLNFSREPVRVRRGERIVQGAFIPILKCAWTPVEDMGNPDRGGYGSTGLI